MINFFLILSGTYSLIILLIINTLSAFIVIPGASVLVASYAAFSTNITNLIIFMLLVLITSVIGDTLTYIIARKFSEKVKRHLLKYKWYSKNKDKNLKFLKRYGFEFVFLSRFLIPGARTIVNYLSGFEKLNFKKFIIAAVLGEMISAAMYSIIGYVFKDTWQDLLNSINYSLTAIVLIIIALYITYKIIKRRRKATSPVHSL